METIEVVHVTQPMQPQWIPLNLGGSCGKGTLKVPTDARDEVRDASSDGLGFCHSKSGSSGLAASFQGASSELAALAMGQKQIAEDVAQMSKDQRAVARIIRQMRKEVAELVAAARSDGVVGQDLESSPLTSPAAEHTEAPAAKEEEQEEEEEVGSHPSLAITLRGPKAPMLSTLFSSTISRDSDIMAYTHNSSERSRSGMNTMSGASGLTGGLSGNFNRITTDGGPALLDDSWPTNIAFRKGLDLLWNRSSGPHSVQDRGSTRGTGSIGLRSAATHTSLPSEQSIAPRGALSLMVDPNALRHMVWDILSMAVLVYDLTVIPYVLAWDIDFDGFLSVTAWSTCIFWTVDIFITFMTGIHINGKLEMNPRTVARNYFRTWFAPDVCVAACDWTSMILMTLVEDSTSGSLKILRFAKVGRLLRIVAMLRMMKFFRAIEEYIESQLSESYKVALKIYILSFGTLFLNHWISCAWIAVGRVAPTDTGLRWVDVEWVMDGQRVEFLQADKLYQYITAFHWSVAQFTLGAIEITCNNTWERLFNIMCLIIGLLFGSTLVSSLSATMVDFQMMKKEKTGKMRKLRQFLRENVVDRRMAIRVQQQAAERLGKKEELREQDVPALKLLSSQLRMELRFGIFQQHLLTHPLFRLWNSLDPTMLQRLCDGTVAFLFFRTKDDIFATGSKADAAYYVAAGTLHYYQDPDTTGKEEFEAGLQVVDQGTWLCEAALWTEWVHVGRAEAATHAKVVAISVDGVMEALKRHRRIREITVEYGRHYHRKVVTAVPPKTEWPTDLQVPFTDWDDMVVAMEKESQVQIGLVALDFLTLQVDAGFSSLWRTDKRGWGKLREEVIRGKSCLLINAAGEVERVASVVVLRIERTVLQGTQVLVQLGKLEGDQMQPSCQLPGGKQESGELPDETLRRLLCDRLEAFDGKIEVQSTSREVQWKPSPEYSVNTKYLRTVCTSSVTGDIDAISFTCPPVLTKSGSHTNLMAFASKFGSERNGTGSQSSSHRNSKNSGGRNAGPSGSAQGVIRAELYDREVMVISDNKQVEDGGDNKQAKVFFAWLMQEEFESMRSPGCEDELSAWLGVLKEHFQQHYQQRQRAERAVGSVGSSAASLAL